MDNQCSPPNPISDRIPVSMGCCVSSEDLESKLKHQEIENQIKQDSWAHKNEVKMLLLGAGESGKSTVVKQMKLIHEGGYTDEERLAFRSVIFTNATQSMKAILEAMRLMGIVLGDNGNHPFASTIVALPDQIEGERLAPGVTEAIRYLWNDRGIQNCFSRSREFQLNDSAIYYFECIERIGQPDYIPNDQDILRSRVKTTGITETSFVVGSVIYRLLDVGGQRSERKKWIHCFEDVMAIIFMVAVSEYDQSLIEDDTVNRMQEALTLFDSICNSRWFVKTSIILFLNKIDLLREKLPISPMSDYFPDFEGGEDFDAATQYLIQRFQALNKSDAKQVYAHLTCATDTQQMSFVMAAVNDIVIQTNLRGCGFL
ncbi:guanine nucleotide-binding protein alpha subunit [Basidiobolus meristosporus CBS 931.73]|uniref:Guanine nucleotide-binding protein alpha subunit n=1 Tax=Basidiobolus meristosporus CBS 931.73 TaxID=1314790 RepID=A0A1Y1Y514_9FUNG|nr:guanine nucleotide-binding protein alpha subunit [Basidiobolus meristosporus CBS 931.73]|eukprot:ORX93110.1 guanine nucleotide-binding protein alpha subunit [Basidiobolus meristosporus CBS 931.73]